MASFIQITDTHVVEPGALSNGRSDTNAALTRAIETIRAKLPLLGPVDCVIVTGDLTDHGTAQEYAHFAALMAPLELEWMAVPGNHDRREPMRALGVKAAWMPETGPIQWHRDLGPFSVIGLDTLVEGAPHGEISEDGFGFLDQALSAAGSQPVVVATHHPWMPSGIVAMDAMNLHNGARLMSRLDRHPGPVRMISGHVHRAMTTQIGRVTCQIGAATCHAVDLDHRPDVREDQLVLEPGGVTLFRWQDTAACLVSDNVATGTFPGPWPFSG
ncbi:MAG: phosphodiesterase [Marinibacterium sp.]